MPLRMTFTKCQKRGVLMAKIVLVEQNKTGKWLADQLGKSTCTVSKWCQNTIQPDLKTLNEIANFLKVDVKDLLVSNI